MPYAETWDLESIYAGGSASKAFLQLLQEMKKSIETVLQTKDLHVAIRLISKISEQMDQAGTFVGCLLAQNVNDERANQLDGQLSDLHALFDKANLQVDDLLCALSEADFTTLLSDKRYAPLAFPLAERRQRRLEKLDGPRENLIADLSTDGYHAWSQLYGSCLGKVEIPVEIEGKSTSYSWGQAYNLLGSPERNLRKQIFESSARVWKTQESLYTHILNHIGGFRLKVYAHRGWDFLKEPLHINRMEKKTLDAMWQAISKNKAPFQHYLKLKAKKMGLESLSWYDLMAPLPQTQVQKTLSYQEAAEFIIHHFSTFSPQMGAFAERAFKEKWIEAENRRGKRPGGFCGGIPLKKESRIFMTFSGTQESLFTLAHELGHAYHNHIIYNEPELVRHFPMNLAETASTFAEMVISEAAYNQEKNPEVKLGLLDSKLQRSAIFLFNIYARFLFEMRFYEERKQGALSTERLCELMTTVQKEAYGEVLGETDPYFWLSKMHFNSTGVPFYNFPYTFGYLFSLGVYLHAKETGSFEQGYNALLADTGRMSAEELAKKHLGVDLTEEPFWQHTLDFLKRDVDAFNV